MNWWFCFVGIVAAGLASRAVPTGFVVFDKYLGDALYAAMVYVILRLVLRGAGWRLALLAMVLMIGIELFQLTMIPARMGILGRLLGTAFGWWDLVAYGVGIVGVFVGTIRWKDAR